MLDCVLEQKVDKPPLLPQLTLEVTPDYDIRSTTNLTGEQQPQLPVILKPFTAPTINVVYSPSENLTEDERSQIGARRIAVLKDRMKWQGIEAVDPIDQSSRTSHCFIRPDIQDVDAYPEAISALRVIKMGVTELTDTSAMAGISPFDVSNPLSGNVAPQVGAAEGQRHENLPILDQINNTLAQVQTLDLSETQKDILLRFGTGLQSGSIVDPITNRTNSSFSLIERFVPMDLRKKFPKPEMDDLKRHLYEFQTLVPILAIAAARSILAGESVWMFQANSDMNDKFQLLLGKDNVVPVASCVEYTHEGDEDKVVTCLVGLPEVLNYLMKKPNVEHTEPRVVRKMLERIKFAEIALQEIGKFNPDLAAYIRSKDEVKPEVSNQ